MKARFPLCICATTLLAATGALRSVENEPKAAGQNSVGITDGRVHAYLPGKSAIDHASARPAVKAEYLIYAAALDQYATVKAALLKDEPVLWRYIERPRRMVAHQARNYETAFSTFAQSRLPKEEADALDEFLAKGYDGKTRYEGALRKDLETYAAELRLSGNQLTERPKHDDAEVAPKLPEPSLVDLKGGMLPGQSQVEAWRNPAKVDFVLYGVSLDQVALSKAELLKAEPILASIVEEKLRLLQWAIEQNSNPHISEDNQAEKVEQLQDLLAKGYRGQFRPAAESLIGRTVPTEK